MDNEYDDDDDDDDDDDEEVEFETSTIMHPKDLIQANGEPGTQDAAPATLSSVNDPPVEQLVMLHGTLHFSQAKCTSSFKESFVEAQSNDPQHLTFTNQETCYSSGALATQYSTTFTIEEPEPSHKRQTDTVDDAFIAKDTQDNAPIRTAKAQSRKESGVDCPTSESASIVSSNRFLMISDI
jgi:hypothetical protein